ncbi:MAG TPA: molybdopterin-dependent oxidoreductase [Streptosporangiaceae bacterium]|nr:molybdopterin-dependent oxidoreductase [Streptosporangiaceae bacterium]
MTLAKYVPASGVMTGLLSGAVGVCVGFLVSGVTGPVGSPVVATAEFSIDLSPPPVKDFAIREFGTHDKLVLQIGVLVVLAVFAAAIGVLAQRSESTGLAGVAIFGAIGLIAAGTRPTANAADLLPSLAGAAAAAFALIRLTRAATRGARAPAGRGKDGQERTAGTQPAGERSTARLTVTEPARRRFITASSVAAGAAAVSYLGGRSLSERESVSAAVKSLHLPAPATPAKQLPAGVDLRVPGLSPFVTPNSRFYRVDTAIVLPQIAPKSWQLRIHGMVSRQITLSFEDLLKRPLIESYITLTCVSNPVGGPYIGNARWLGASLGALLREAGIMAGADQLYCTSFDGFTSGTPVQTAMDGRDALLAIGMNGQPLPTAHGFPVRTVVPGLYGYVSACKWITDIEVTTYAANRAYWTDRGWSEQAPIKTESRIDVPSAQGPVKAGQTAIAGVAWAQHKGIDAVEVRVDRGPWRQARLASVPGIDTWRQWTIAWNATPGTHQIEARATDASGYTQTALTEPPEPNGATGYPVVTVTVTR